MTMSNLSARIIKHVPAYRSCRCCNTAAYNSDVYCSFGSIGVVLIIDHT